MAGFTDTYETFRCGTCQYVTVHAGYAGEGLCRSMDTEPRGTASLDSEPVGAELTGTECKMESWAQAAGRVPPLPAHSTPR